MDAGIHKVSIVSEQMHQYWRQQQEKKIAQLEMKKEYNSEIQLSDDQRAEMRYLFKEQ